MRYVWLLLVLAGCASNEWERADGKPEPGSALQADWVACQKDFAAMQNRYQADMLVDECLKSKGWRQR